MRAAIPLSSIATGTATVSLSDVLTNSAPRSRTIINVVQMWVWSQMRFVLRIPYAPA